MPIIKLETRIESLPEVCFDLARDIGLHCSLAAHTKERAVEGITRGLIGAGEWVTFEGVHFGVRQRLTVKITEFDPPRRFVDESVKGAFSRLKHTHEFIPVEGGTPMKDTLEWVSPLGGWAVSPTGSS